MQSSRLPSHESWRNWMGNLHCAPKAIFRPRNLEELQESVRQAAALGGPIRAAGTGHSWSPLVPTDGCVIETTQLNRVLSADTDTLTLVCETGIGLQDLTVAAARLGMAFQSHPDATEVSVGGIVATGSNGSGISQPPLSDAVIGFTIVRADGEVVEIDASSHDIHAARLSLGTLGIVYSLTIQCLPAIPMRVEDRVVSIPSVLRDLERIVDENDAVMMFWYPYTDKLWMKYWNAAPDQRVNFGWWQRTTGEVSQYIGRKLLGGPLLWLLHRIPQLTPMSMKSALWFTRETTYIEDAADAFHFEYVNPLLWDACYAVPMDQAAAAWRGLMSLVEEFRDRGRYPLNMVTTSRFTRKSSTLLSPAYDRDSCFLEAITSKGTPHIGEFYRAFEDMMMGDFDGRPHWAKVYYQIPRVRGVYEKRLAEFEEVRGRWDPEGALLNPFLSKLMGPSSAADEGPSNTTNP